MSFLYRESKYELQERTTHSAIQYALEVARNRRIVRPNGRCLSTGSALDWIARRNWTRALCEEVEAYFGLDETRVCPSEPIFFFTLADLSCIYSADEVRIDTDRFKRIYRAGLEGLNYVAFIEPAFYTNLSADTFWSGKRAMSWHVHGFAWGETRADIAIRFANLNANGVYKPIMEGLAGAHVKRIPRQQLADKLRYIFKTPRKVYRLYKYEIVSKDGEIIFGFKQKTSDPRPGEWITLFSAMHDLDLEDLAFAGGRGSVLLRRVKGAFNAK